MFFFMMLKVNRNGLTTDAHLEIFKNAPSGVNTIIPCQQFRVIRFFLLFLPLSLSPSPFFLYLFSFPFLPTPPNHRG